MESVQNKTFQIAIDGPVAAGKGTTAKLVAKRLGFLYVDTGAMYRGLTLFIKQEEINWEDEREIIKILIERKPSVMLSIPKQDEVDGRLCTVKLNGVDVSWKIRAEKISRGVSIITQYSAVRDYVTPMARMIANKHDVVMEGRDITSVVLPEADVLIYMDAKPKERARRRHRELLMRGEDVSFEEVLEELMKRDERDSTRKIAPLMQVKNAWKLDTMGMTIDEVAEKIINNVEEMRDKK